MAIEAGAAERPVEQIMQHDDDIEVGRIAVRDALANADLSGGFGDEAEIAAAVDHVEPRASRKYRRSPL